MNTQNNIAERIYSTHKFVLGSVSELTQDQLTKQLAPTSPAIGWHLWHIARWADRLQASLTSIDELTDKEVWHMQGMAEAWGLDPEKLGKLETGTGMDSEDAAALPGIAGRDRIMAYAESLLNMVDDKVRGLAPEDYDGASIYVGSTDSSEETHAHNLVFHIQHTSRHLGMIEALRGLLDMQGTATI